MACPPPGHGWPASHPPAPPTPRKLPKCRCSVLQESPRTSCTPRPVIPSLGGGVAGVQGPACTDGMHAPTHDWPVAHHWASRPLLRPPFPRPAMTEVPSARVSKSLSHIRHPASTGDHFVRVPHPLLQIATALQQQAIDHSIRGLSLRYCPRAPQPAGLPTAAGALQLRRVHSPRRWHSLY